MKKIAVIGAGLSGLTFASQMKSKADITVFEKSRGIGGRMATRYAGDYEFDHGAQYFTAKGEIFQKFLEPYLSLGIIKEWQPNLVTFSKNGMAKRISNHPSYVASPRMNSLAKELAKEINLVGNTHIEKLSGEAGSWILTDKENNIHGSYDYVVFAIPSHQAVVILPDDFKHRSRIESAKMDACFSLMLGFKDTLDFGFDGAFVESSPIGWISVNSSKPERTSGFSIMVQSQNQWAEDHVDDDKAKIQGMLIEEASALLKQDLSIAAHQVLHRWLYASTSIPADVSFLLDDAYQIATIGDWCIRGRVEAAFESGYQLAQTLSTKL